MAWSKKPYSGDESYENLLDREHEEKYNSLKKENQALKKISESYNELIAAVESKFPKESKHQTALRYIRDREIKISYSCSADLPVTTK